MYFAFAKTSHISFTNTCRVISIQYREYEHTLKQTILGGDTFGYHHIAPWEFYSDKLFNVLLTMINVKDSAILVYSFLPTVLPE